MKKLLVLLCACLALGLVAAGCGDDDEDSNGGGAAATTEQTEATTAEETATEEAMTDERTAGGDAAPDSAEVDIVDIDYEPREVTVAKGAKVTWTNTGDLPHTVTLEDGPGEDFDSGTLSPGDTYEQTFSKPGTYDYICTIHSGQRGTVVVE